VSVDPWVRGKQPGERRGKKKDVHERALGLLAVRQRSRRELERRLVQAGFEHDEVAEELRRLEDVGLIDDEAFARAVVEGRMGSRGESRRVVAGRLAQAGVARDVAVGVLDEATEGDEQRAERLAATRVTRLSGLAPEVAFDRLYGFLARRGYPSEVARSVARRTLAVEAIED
jgi:regulatory protein